MYLRSGKLKVEMKVSYWLVKLRAIHMYLNMLKLRQERQQTSYKVLRFKSGNDEATVDNH